MTYGAIVDNTCMIVFAGSEKISSYIMDHQGRMSARFLQCNSIFFFFFVFEANFYLECIDDLA